jgi:hypothetical protein
MISSRSEIRIITIKKKNFTKGKNNLALMEMEILHNCDKKLCRLKCTAGKWFAEMPKPFATDK